MQNADKILEPNWKVRQEADIRACKPNITIVCKTIDDIAAKEDLHEDLEKEFDLIELPELAINMLRHSYGVPQIAIISFGCRQH